MDPPSNNNNDNVDNDAVALGIAAAMAADEDQDEEDVDADEAICQEAITLLQNRLTFHSRLRDRTMVQFAQQFINNVKEDIYQTISDSGLEEEGYDGFDSERDTAEEVERAIRCCPEVLSREDEIFGWYPINCITFGICDDKFVMNVKAVSFVPLFVRLAIEFRSFNETERGGLVIEDAAGDNGLQDLMYSSHPSFDEEHHERVDTSFLAVLIRLRRLGYLLKNDIQHYNLVHCVCRDSVFPKQRFRFLTEWDPASLLQIDEYGSLPLHRITEFLRTNANNELPFHWVADTLRQFQVLLDAYFRYYPRWKGIKALFTLNNVGETPFEFACKTLTQPRVMEVVEEILSRYITNTGLVNTTTANNNNGNAMLLAASEDTMSLDGLFFLIRRQPDTMLSMLRHRNKNSNNSATNQNSTDPGGDSTASDENNGREDSSSRHNENNHNNTAGNHDHDSNNDHSTVTVLQRSTGKRKRN